MIQDLALPVAFTAVLQNVFQFLKPLLEMIPGFRTGDAHHDDLLRILFCVICFAGAVIFVIQQGMVLDPLTILACFNAAIGMTYGAHLTYKNVTKGGTEAKSSVPVEPDVLADESNVTTYPDVHVQGAEEADSTPLVPDATDAPSDA